MKTTLIPVEATDMDKIKIRLNPLYWVLIPLLLVGIWKLNQAMTGYQSEFLGFAENKQSDINTDQDMEVKKVWVTHGQSVRKGDTLISGIKPGLDEEILQATLTREGLAAKITKERQELNAEISRLQNELETKESSLQAKIDAARSESSFFRSLTGAQQGISDEAAHLEKELSEVRASYRKLIHKYKEQLNTPNPVFSQIRQEDAKKEFAVNQKKRLFVTAPFDGIMANVNVREGESIRSFTTIGSMYEPTPPLVIGYINEKHNTHLSVGDSVSVSSLYHPDKSIKGIIVTKGQRIIEIPEKFRKLADVKTYGVEVYIKISPGNAFLQKEVLKIRPKGLS